jgi:hypothetical protein
LIIDSYKDPFIQIQTKSGFSGRIGIGKGVKQGCPLSPTIFNIGLNPLLRYLRRNFEEFGSKYNEGRELQTKIVQAYADDLLLFANSKENMNHLIDGVITYMNYAQININPDKCKFLVYNRNGEVDADFTLPHAQGVLQALDRVEIDEVFRYLGVPVGVRKIAKMKFSNEKIEKVKKIIDKIARSGLKVNQVINAVKTFILPKLDYSMMNSVVSLGELNKVDQLIRKEINGLIGGPPLSKDMFYSSWKYGGLGIKNMRER